MEFNRLRTLAGTLAMQYLTGIRPQFTCISISARYVHSSAEPIHISGVDQVNQLSRAAAELMEASPHYDPAILSRQ